VWVQLDAYESDLAWIRYGQDVDFGVEAYPGEIFHGRVAFIDPTLDDRTRTVKVRLNVDNADQRLKPDMFVSATAQAMLTKHGKVVDEGLAGKWMCPMHPEVISDGPEACPECGMDLVPATELGFTASTEDAMSLVIPHTAPLVTGKRGVVYVRLPDTEKPTFEGREIALGPRAGNWYVVYEGLEVGEDVVVHGNFKIDSELQIRAKQSMMTSDGIGPPPAPLEPVAVSAPLGFRKQLGHAVEAYLVLHKELSTDEDSPAAAKVLVEALGAVDMALLEGDAHMAWMDMQADLLNAAAELAAADGIEQRRNLLAPLTERLVRALKTFGYEAEGGQVGVFHCPMALDGEGADWIQVAEKTSNPYYGSAMIGCGDLEETLSRGPLSDAGSGDGGSSEAGTVPAPMEFQQQLGEVVDAYLNLQKVLTRDEDSQAMAQRVVETLAAVDMSLLEGSGHMTWMGQLPGLRKAAADLAAAGDLEARRAALSPMTGALVQALKTFGYKHDDGPVGVFHCPMALGGDGADWIQLGDETSNPYYGSSMLGCGSRTELLKQDN
jgi:membrane fusion protein, copper/silver efflux system